MWGYCQLRDSELVSWSNLIVNFSDRGSLFVFGFSYVLSMNTPFRVSCLFWWRGCCLFLIASQGFFIFSGYQCFVGRMFSHIPPFGSGLAIFYHCFLRVNRNVNFNIIRLFNIFLYDLCFLVFQEILPYLESLRRFLSYSLLSVFKFYFLVLRLMPL